MVMLPRNVFMFLKTAGPILDGEFPERVNKLTTASAKFSLVRIFVMFSLLYVTKDCLLSMFFFEKMLTKSSVLDGFIINFYCNKEKADSGRMNPFNQSISAIFT